MQSLLTRAKKQINAAADLIILDKVRIVFLGKNGELSQLFSKLSQINQENKAKEGAKINNAKKQIQNWLQQKKIALSNASLKKQTAEQLDISLPQRKQRRGHLHPITQILNRVITIFNHQGFSVKSGPEIENDFYNFSALNIPESHPARTLHDTFYFNKIINNERMLLRTHTSPVQIRTLRDEKPPLKIIAPGRVYRCDSDMTHTPMFHQVEGLLVDKNLNFAQLKGLLSDFLSVFFAKKDLKVRFRPAYFPFTEPSAEMDITCIMCGGDGCRVCKGSGYIEILGCGVVHPNVFKAVDLDDGWRGLAFGMGIERLAMLRFGVDDLRLFFENHYRFLEQF